MKDIGRKKDVTQERIDRYIEEMKARKRNVEKLMRENEEQERQLMTTKFKLLETLKQGLDKLISIFLRKPCNLSLKNVTMQMKVNYKKGDLDLN